ncbi:hypothetical protein ABXN37_13875 [Piscinibacter sakaiensis]|uniref:Uncharacterized protein n=1 Tax=Piscinibacter sakaiensis TaxID=1547922 RepID=A0A0K8P0Q3_PISS1|nr:hypothetical protein [Piscinibacter sakaiensis]GAP36237.1 hypothetical protein ISF6_2077 [Piscinibacter sakaiensis]
MDWGASDKGAQQNAVAETPNGSATGAPEECPGCPPPGPPPGPGPVPPPIDPPVTTPVITRIEWLDGQEDEVLSGEGLHFVNLPVSSKWVKTKLAANKRRLGEKPGFKVWFDQPGSHHFRVKLVPQGGNAVYSTVEKGRNGHKFKADKGWHSYTTDGDGTKVVKTGPQLTVAGGDKYLLEAHDDQAVVVKSSLIKTIRALYVVRIKMSGLTAAASSISGCSGEYAKHHIRLVELPAVSITHQHNIGTTADTNTLKANVQTAWEGSGKPKAPYAIGLVFTDHLAVKNPNRPLTYTNVQVGPGKPALRARIMGAGLTSTAVEARALWRDLVPGESWFVSCSYQPNGGGAPVTIDPAQCTPSTASGYSDRVDIDVSGLPAGTGSVTLTVNWVDRMRAGISLGGSPTVLVCTRSWWTDETTAAQNEVLVHELGHHFGMVPEGTDPGLERHDKQYIDRGHVGSHCREGTAALVADFNAAGASDGASCVMFGSTNGHKAFCSLCAPQVRKVDLTAGW